MAVYVSVCGPSRCTEEDERNARVVGTLLAERGAHAVCSGYSGVAVALAAGMRAAGGTCIGILWGKDRTGASPDYSYVLPTGIDEAGDVVVARSGDAMIVIGGSWGTLSEIGNGMRWGKPVISLGGWQILDKDGQHVPGIDVADSPEQAVELALILGGQQKGNQSAR